MFARKFYAFTSDIRNIKCINSLFHKHGMSFYNRKTLSGRKKQPLSNQNGYDSSSVKIKQIGYLYLKDPVSADTIAGYLCENWNEGYIFELNPGPGVLSKAILSKGAPFLRVFERNEEYLSTLKDLSNLHSNFEIIEEDFLHLPSLESRPSHNYPQVLDTFFEGISEYSWDDSKKIKAEPKENYSNYRWSTVLYNLFFEIKCLQQFDHKICATSSKRDKKKDEDHSLYFVKLSPKPELFTSVVNGNRVPEFYFFIRHHLAKRTGLIIPTMEGWIPCCGPRLIKEGMHVFTKFGDLSPKQLLALFNQFSSWPEYEDCVFHAALQRYYGRGPLGEEEEEAS